MFVLSSLNKECLLNVRQNDVKRINTNCCETQTDSWKTGKRLTPISHLHLASPFHILRSLQNAKNAEFF